MTEERSSAEIRRLRAALVLMLVGVALIIWVWGNWMYRSANLSTTRVVPRVNPALASQVKVQAAQGLSWLLLVGFILLLLVLIGGYLIVRAGRRHRDGLMRQRSSPSASSDIWSRQKPRPIDLDDEEDFEEPPQP